MRHRSMLARLALGVLFAVVLRSVGFAQYVIPYATVEAMTGQARAVYLGEVVSTSDPVGANGTFDVTVRVTEVLKGEPAKNITIPSTALANEVDQLYTRSVYPAWAHHKTPVLWFSFDRRPKKNYVEWLVPQFRLANRLYPEPAPVVWEPLRLGHRVQEESPARNPSPMRILSLDFTVLDTPDKILNAVRRFVRQYPGPVEAVTMTVPAVITNLVQPGGGRELGGQVLFVPAVDEWRRVARELIQNPQKLLSKTTLPVDLKPEEREPFMRKLEAVLRDQLKEALDAMKSLKPSNVGKG